MQDKFEFTDKRLLSLLVWEVWQQALMQQTDFSQMQILERIN